MLPSYKTSFTELYLPRAVIEPINRMDYSGTRDNNILCIRRKAHVPKVQCPTLGEVVLGVMKSFTVSGHHILCKAAR